MVSAAVLAFVWTSGDLRAQCTESLMFSANLTANDSYTDSLLLFGDLTSMTVNLDVVTEGGSYPSDLMMYIYAADGDCIVWGGWNVLPEPGCTDLGTGTGGAWPGEWNTTADGFYTATFDLTPYGLTGAGYWSVTVVNAYTCLLYTSPSPRD